MMTKRAVFLAGVLAMATGCDALAQRGTGGSGDPTVKAAGDPHGAIRSMSEASVPGSKSEHSTTTVPHVVPSGSDSAPPQR